MNHRMNVMHGLAAQHGIELPGAIERSQIVKAADVLVIYIYLWHGATPRALHHLFSARRLQVNADLFDRGDAFVVE